MPVSFFLQRLYAANAIRSCFSLLALRLTATVAVAETPAKAIKLPPGVQMARDIAYVEGGDEAHALFLSADVCFGPAFGGALLAGVARRVETVEALFAGRNLVALSFGGLIIGALPDACAARQQKRWQSEDGVSHGVMLRLSPAARHKVCTSAHREQWRSWSLIRPTACIHA